MSITITSTLPNFAQVNQLTDSWNGKIDPDNRWDCVPSALCDGLRFLTGQRYDPFQLKSAVYGPTYLGGQAAAAYVAYCKAQGVLLAPYNGTPAQLVACAHAALRQQHPVVATIPSLWGIPRDQQRPGYTTHVVCFAGAGPGTLRASNPWIAPVWHDNSDAYWEAELCENQIWLMSALHTNGGPTVGIPTGWKDSANGDPNNGNGVLTAPNGQTVQHGFRYTILTNSWQAENVPLGGESGGNPCDPTDPASGAGTNQLFAYLMLVYHQATGKITVTAAGAVAAYYKAHQQTAPSAPSEPAAPSAPDPVVAALRSNLQQFLAGK